VEGTGGASLALHLDDVRDDPLQIGARGGRLRVCPLSHRRRGCDGVHRDHLAQAVSHGGDRFVGVRHDGGAVRPTPIRGRVNLHLGRTYQFSNDHSHHPETGFRIRPYVGVYPQTSGQSLTR
jgi:hypothetical protein